MAKIGEQQIEILKVEIGKLNLGEGDYLVLKFPDETPFIERIEGLAYQLKEALPELANKIILVVDDVELYVVHKENNG